ncbi:MAG: dihydroneopterin aldolase, partial [Pseudomonadota bacterium]|nr:dihydroneopterin aldolase [Pseudomonadota bacterium]
ITKGIISFVENNKFELVETFAEKIAEMVIKDFNIDEIRLRVSKPGALRFSKDVGVIIERDKSSYE